MLACTRQLSVWIIAARPKTLVASLTPVTISGILFYQKHNVFPFWVFGGCLLFSLFVQVGSNYANDYYDYLRGADKERNLGPNRFVASGEISPFCMKVAWIFTLSIAFVIGLVTLLFANGSYWFLSFGVASVVCAVLYTAGPYAFAYNGLGDVFVILFFGIGAYEGTSYILSCAEGVGWKAFWLLSLSMGLLINNILIVNNFRDYESDKQCGKKSLVVKLGKNFAIFQYLTGFLIPTFLLPYFYNHSALMLLILPVSTIGLIKLYFAKKRQCFDLVLTLTVFAVLIFGLTVVIN